MQLTPLEAAVLRKVLAGDHPVLAALRQQLSGLTASTRKLTGVGFFTELTVADTCSPAAIAVGIPPFGAVAATIDGLAHGAGFVLFVKDGLIAMLEGYSYDEPWPERIEGFSLAYWHADRTAELAKLDRAPAP